MSLYFQSPLSGGPATRQLRDREGRPVFMIKPAVLTPKRAKVVADICDALKAALWLTGLVTLVLLYGNQALTLEVVAAVIIGLVIAYGCIRQVLRRVFRKRTVIRMTVDAISVRGIWGWRHYERAVRHSVLMLSHDLAAWERETIELKRRQAAQRGRVIQPPSYYGYSVHVALIYGGHRVDLLEVYDGRYAGPIVSRLQYCDELLYEFEGKSKGPRDGDWDRPAPGGL